MSQESYNQRLANSIDCLARSEEGMFLFQHLIRIGSFFSAEHGESRAMALRILGELGEARSGAKLQQAVFNKFFQVNEEEFVNVAVVEHDPLAIP